MAHLGSWEWDVAQNRVIWSDEVFSIFGLKPNEFDPTYEAFLAAALYAVATLRREAHPQLTDSEEGFLFPNAPEAVFIETPFSEALRDAIEANRQAGILFIAAAGNNWSNNDLYPQYPCNYYLPNIISVASTDHFDNLSWFSNYGSRTVHIGAPGSNILSTLPEVNTYGITGGYGSFDGTSMATPHAAGISGLIKAHEPNRTWAEIKNLILSGGTSLQSLQGKTITGKRADAYGSLTCASKNGVVALPLMFSASAIFRAC